MDLGFGRRPDVAQTSTTRSACCAAPVAPRPEAMATDRSTTNLRLLLSADPTAPDSETVPVSSKPPSSATDLLDKALEILTRYVSPPTARSILNLAHQRRGGSDGGTDLAQLLESIRAQPPPLRDRSRPGAAVLLRARGPGGGAPQGERGGHRAHPVRGRHRQRPHRGTARRRAGRLLDHRGDAADDGDLGGRAQHRALRRAGADRDPPLDRAARQSRSSPATGDRGSPTSTRSSRATTSRGSGWGSASAG